MPIYEYACPQCRKNFEEWLRSVDDASTHPCPVCGTTWPRIISNTTFILMGGGWYVREYGSHHAESEDAAPAGQDAKEGATEAAPAENAGKEHAPAAETPAPAKSGKDAAPLAEKSKPAAPAAPPASATPAKPAAAAAGA